MERIMLSYHLFQNREDIESPRSIPRCAGKPLENIQSSSRTSGLVVVKEIKHGKLGLVVCAANQRAHEMVSGAVNTEGRYATAQFDFTDAHTCKGHS